MFLLRQGTHLLDSDKILWSFMILSRLFIMFLMPLSVFSNLLNIIKQSAIFDKLMGVKCLPAISFRRDAMLRVSTMETIPYPKYF